MALAQGFGDGLEGDLLDKEFGATNYTPPATHYVGLFTSSPGGGGGTELTGGSYARVAVTNDTDHWTRTGNAVSNAQEIAFPTATADWARATHWGVFESNVATEPRAYGELLGPPQVFTADAATGTLTATGHGLANGTRVKVRNSGGTLPAGLSEATTYYVRDAGADTFRLSLTDGGAAVGITDAGTGTHTVHEDHSKQAESGDTLKIAAGGLVITLD